MPSRCRLQPEVLGAGAVGCDARGMSALGLAALLLVPAAASAQSSTEALTIGETFTIESAVLGETRRINVYRPAIYGDSAERALPVLYMPDGGIGEDFLHIAGLVQVSTMNGTMRPVLLVGIENTQRRRDLTGPTQVAEDRAIAPEVGGSARFREFLRTELMPEVEARYRTTRERGIVGESLAGLFIVETFVLEPELFDVYMAFDPSLWWNSGALLQAVPHGAAAARGRTVYLASSSEPSIAELTRKLAGMLDSLPGVSLHYAPMSEETHATIYHPAALKAFRHVYHVPDTP